MSVMTAPRARPLSVLFVHMPMADPVLPNLGAEILAATLRCAGARAHVFYATLRFPPAVSPQYVHGLAGHGAFTPLYFDLDIDAYVEEVVAGLARAGPCEPEKVAEELHAGAAAAELCIERCLEEIDVLAYDVVAFSVIFDTQKVPSATLAARLKARRPSLRILFGGTGCDGPMAEALLEHFPEIDAVFRGDADLTIEAVCRYLVQPGPGAPDGLITRSTRNVSSPPVIRDLSMRPVPDYASFIAQRAASPYATPGKLTLLFEASRGCWWADSRHCLFCGIRTVREGYRELETQRAFAEIVALHERYGAYLLYATDAILSRTHLCDLLPKLARYRAAGHADLRLFFEAKSNMTRAEVALLCAAGVVSVQPGIESFSTRVLQRIGKGATARKQIEVLKWLCAYGIETIYGLLTRTPGETPDDLFEQTQLLSRLHHFPPPIGVNPLALHRFSPYFADPGKYGIRNLRPHALHSLAYRGPKERLLRLCYEAEYDSCESSNPEHRRAEDALRDAVANWQAAYARGATLSSTRLGNLTLVTRITEHAKVAQVLTQTESAILACAAQPVTLGRIQSIMQLDEAQVRTALRVLEDANLIVAVDGCWLSVVIPIPVDAARDAGLATDVSEGQSLGTASA